MNMHFPCGRLRSSLSVVLLTLGLALGPTAHAQTQAPESDLKAAIISNMLLFVDWPTAGALAAPDDQLVVCYQGPSPVADALVRLDGKSVKGKVLTVVQVGNGKTGQCHAFYLAPGNSGNLGAILPDLGKAPIFVAADSPEYAKYGVMLNLDLAGGRVVFDIDLRSAQKAGLQISSKALRLARQVIE